MKSLSESLYESLLDDFDTINSNVTQEIVKRFLSDNYDGKYTISKTPNKDGLYEVSAKRAISVKNLKITSLTNDLFVWGKVGGPFNCSECNSLTSLKGAPEKVDGDFNCSECNSLTSLEGAPKEVGGIFYCAYCKSLTSLEGAPKEVDGYFDCSDCNSLTTLKGAPEKFVGWFDCSNCNSLTSLKGAPKEVRGNFSCKNCKNKFTVADIIAVSNVKGEMRV